MSDPYGGYSQYPSAPDYGWQQPQLDRGPRPRTVDAAFVLMLLRCVLSVVSIVVTVSSRDEIKRKILDRTPTASASTIDSIINIGIVLGVVFLVLYAALAFVVRSGKNWARIVTWVFAGLGVAGLLFSFAQPTVALSRVIAIGSGLIDIALIVLLAVRPSGEYFSPRHLGPRRGY